MGGDEVRQKTNPRVRQEREKIPCKLKRRVKGKHEKDNVGQRTEEWANK